MRKCIIAATLLAALVFVGCQAGAGSGNAPSNASQDAGKSTRALEAEADCRMDQHLKVKGFKKTKERGFELLDAVGEKKLSGRAINKALDKGDIPRYSNKCQVGD